MDVDGSLGSIQDIINFLIENQEVPFKSQQRDEMDLTRDEKSHLAKTLYHTNRRRFFDRFGTYLDLKHLELCMKIVENDQDIEMLLNQLITLKKQEKILRKNRRFEALKRLITDGVYFSEIEMMKRDPKLYDQLIGRFLSPEERKNRDRIMVQEGSTVSSILLEVIDRTDVATSSRRFSEESEEDLNQECAGKWGEFASTSSKRTEPVSVEEKQRLKQEFLTQMYQRFLSGEDEDFNYAEVDQNTNYDDNSIMDLDAEDRYFDSEEAEVDVPKLDVSEDDELDVFMSQLNQRNPEVQQLSKDFHKM